MVHSVRWFIYSHWACSIAVTRGYPTSRVPKQSFLVTEHGHPNHHGWGSSLEQLKHYHSRLVQIDIAICASVRMHQRKNKHISTYICTRTLFIYIYIHIWWLKNAQCSINHIYPYITINTIHASWTWKHIMFHSLLHLWPAPVRQKSAVDWTALPGLHFVVLARWKTMPYALGVPWGKPSQTYQHPSDPFGVIKHGNGKSPTSSNLLNEDLNIGKASLIIICVVGPSERVLQLP